MSKTEHGHWEGGTENFTMQRAIEWQRERERPMTMSNQVTSDIRLLPMVALVFSDTPAQVERRKGFSPEKLQELADSIKSEGLLQPIVVRPTKQIVGVPSPEFEVVAGERRVRASKIAGKEEILASVRDLTDQQVAKIQLIENIQREDVHPLAEAEGYEELLKKHGYSVEQIAAETGKSKAYIYARVKLLALDPSSRKLFQEGKLSASIALLIARIPVASLQRKASGEIANPRFGGGREPMSYRDALDYIQDEYMLCLEEAPFPTDRDGLVRNVGPCGTCPKRTGNQPQLFEDIKGADVCTDPTCFKAKREAWGKQQLGEAKAKGQRVITGTEAKRIKPSEHGDYLSGGYTRLDEKCWDDPKKRTYRQLIAGKDAATELLQVPKTGEVIEIIQGKTAMKAAGIKKPSPAGTSRSNSSDNAKIRADRAKAEREEALRVRVLKEIQAKAPRSLERDDLEGVATMLFDSRCGDEEELYEQLGWPAPSGTDWQRFMKAFPVNLKKLSVGELNGVILGLVLQNLDAKLMATAKRYKIDVERIRKELDAAAKAEAPAKTPKKKAARK